MTTVTISREFQITVPKRIREELGLVPGQRLEVAQHADRIELVVTRSVECGRGFLAGIDTTVPRDDDRV